MIDPQDVVFQFISSNNKYLNVPLLSKIYNQIRGTENPFEIRDFTDERILQEMVWWCVTLNLPEYYFRTTPPEQIAHQIATNRIFEIHGTDSEAYSNMKISFKSQTGTSVHWVHLEKSLELEEEIEQEFYAGKNKPMRISGYKCAENLMLYTVEENTVSEACSDFQSCAPKSFIEQDDEKCIERYKTLWQKVQTTNNIIIEKSKKQETGENRIMIGFPVGAINHFLSNISRTLKRCGIAVSRKYTSTFGGLKPVIISSLYSNNVFPDDLLAKLTNVSIYPRNELCSLVESDQISVEELIFANSAIHFIHLFISQPDPSIKILRGKYKSDSEVGEILKSLQRKSDKDAFPHSFIINAMLDRPDIIRDLYNLFNNKFNPNTKKCENTEGLADKLLKKIEDSTHCITDAEIFRWAVTFVESILRTNFYLPEKSSVSFRLKNDFLQKSGFELMPYGILFVVDRHFHGFHVRFKEIARGGIRIVHSTTYDDYLRNSDYIFEECYNLAYTQNLKNKDIPEGGSKGTICLDHGCSRLDGESAFKSYVDGLLDLLLPHNKEKIHNWQEEILLLGPDEGSAELMDWACERARSRDYKYWKSFTTGKHARLGGISHIDYGMTTNGIHEFVLGILDKLGIPENTITKVQTGGPDGDLGSNEILISKDKTIAVVDGGGVLYDPCGLNRTELTRLAKTRKDSSYFNPKKLSPKGFLVKVTDRNVNLPNGNKIVSGMTFRNNFHLDPRMKADLFVPCGGRPKSINSTNWQQLFNADGVPKFKWIVEGANLFITPEARLKLESKDIIVFKDSSTNKGGVISSSLEVLAGLALTEKDFLEHMTHCHNGKEPEFRKKYINEVIHIVKKKARMEFETLWNSHKTTGCPFSEMSDCLSSKINEITNAVESSDLFDNIQLRKNVLSMHIPATLLNKIGINNALKNIPTSYQKAIFSKAIASNFIYAFGINPGFEDYRKFIKQLGTKKFAEK